MVKNSRIEQTSTQFRLVPYGGNWSGSSNRVRTKRILHYDKSELPCTSSGSSNRVRTKRILHHDKSDALAGTRMNHNKQRFWEINPVAATGQGQATVSTRDVSPSRQIGIALHVFRVKQQGPHETYPPSRQIRHTNGLPYGGNWSRSSNRFRTKRILRHDRSELPCTSSGSSNRVRTKRIRRHDKSDALKGCPMAATVQGQATMSARDVSPSRQIGIALHICKQTH